MLKKMEKEIKKLHEILTKDRQVSPWSKQDTFLERSIQLHSETDEIIQAVKKNDIENLKEELGDALWDIMFISIIAEEKGFFTFKDTINAALEKIERRKPWIATGEKISIEEEQKRWKEIKQKEH
jgi:NTP pyrophosphatase (non-canonical NTP hydrolase)